MVETEKLYSSINAGDFRKKLDSADHVVCLDVRTREEYLSGHIHGARNLDVLSLDFVSRLDELDKNKTYLVYCRSGSRSANACAMMASRGFEVYNLLGGVMYWPGPLE